MDMHKEFDILSEKQMNELLDLYQMKDWGCSWVQFLEIYTEVHLETIGNWQLEEIG